MAVTPIYGPPTVTPAVWRRTLETAGSPAAPFAADLYRVPVRHGMDPAFWLAVFRHESRYATDPRAVVARYRTLNWGNTRTIRKPGLPGSVVATDRGPFVRYRTWLDGLEDACYRVADPAFAYAGLRTVEQVIPVWAPSSDTNNVGAYVEAVRASMGEYAKGEGAVKVAVAAGHLNADGGNPYEIETVRVLGPAIVAECRRLGLDTRYVSPVPGPVGDVGATVVRWGREGWRADVFLECHTQGVANPSVRGAFAIYPDWPALGDVDADARDKLGPSIVRRCVAAFGGRLAVAPSGPTMSERRTGVGLDGWRLGVFAGSIGARDYCTRLLVEYGAHSNPVERTLHREPDFAPTAARATAEAIAEFLGVDVVEANRPKFFVVEPFASFDREAVGAPISGMYFDHVRGRLVQWFERGRLSAPPNGREVEVDPIGAEYLADLQARGVKVG